MTLLREWRQKKFEYINCIWNLIFIACSLVFGFCLVKRHLIKMPTYKMSCSAQWARIKTHLICIQCVVSFMENIKGKKIRTRRAVTYVNAKLTCHRFLWLGLSIKCRAGWNINDWIYPPKYKFINQRVWIIFFILNL